MIPFLVHFSPLATFTRGLEAEYPGYQLVPDGVGLVTNFLATEGWMPPIPIVTGWTVCCAAPATSWSDVYIQPTTGWTAA